MKHQIKNQGLIDDIFQISAALQTELNKIEDVSLFPSPLKTPTVSSKIQPLMHTETGKSAVTIAAIAAAEIIVYADGTRISRPLRYSWQIGKDVHMLGSGLVNHHCTHPTCIVDFETNNIVAAHDLTIGERITLNYFTTEYAMTTAFQCKCGAAGCYGQMQGYKYLSDKQRRVLEQNFEVAPFLLDHD